MVKVEMTREEFIKRVVGRTITAIKLQRSDSSGVPLGADDVAVSSFKLDNGITLVFFVLFNDDDLIGCELALEVDSGCLEI